VLSGPDKLYENRGEGLPIRLVCLVRLRLSKAQSNPGEHHPQTSDGGRTLETCLEGIYIRDCPPCGTPSSAPVANMSGGYYSSPHYAHYTAPTPTPAERERVLSKMSKEHREEWLAQQAAAQNAAAPAYMKS
jgi:hypothetical protein